MKRILVVGGAGFVGSHAAKALARAGYEPIVLDNLSQGSRAAVKWGPLVACDILDSNALDEAFRTYRPDGVMHFAALAYVGESVVKPANYYRNNVAGTLSLLEAMLRNDVGRIVFSSSCAIYGIPARLPIVEDFPKAPINPYGRSKLMVEHILEDFRVAYGLSYAALRYFNAAGADPDGELAERHDPETHLIPRALLAAAGKIPHLEIFGTELRTPDGTSIRDYIHVTDLAAAHVSAIRRLASEDGGWCWNLGTGSGFSIAEVVASVERSTGRRVPTLPRPPRPGDPPELVADPSAARAALGFAPSYSDLDTIIQTAWPTFR